MTLARTTGVALVGVDGALVEIEAHIAPGLPSFALVGLPDASLYEARDRVRAAVVNSRERWPATRVTVGLSPASLPKKGSSFDVAIAAAILLADGQGDPSWLRSTALLGELGLDGRLRAVRGVLPAVAAAARAGMRRVVVPEGNVAEAQLVPDIEVFGLRSLRQLLALLRDEPVPDDEAAHQPPPMAEDVIHEPLDLADVFGQELARHAIEVAAAGGHAIYLMGTPGSGKTMLAERLPGLLPDLDHADALEVTAVHSLAGLLHASVPLVTRPPLQAPHHSATVAALVGGGSGLPRPGAVSLAHRGVLFMDEAPEFAPSVLDALRQPLESGVVTLSRAAGTARYPARTTFVLASNPCPCGLAVGKGLDCTCTAIARRRYLSRLSGPLLDRVDLRVDVRPPGVGHLRLASGENTATVAARVHDARRRSAARLTGTPWRTNAELPGSALRGRWPVADAAPIERAISTGALTLRGADRVARVAWTLADLEGASRPQQRHVAAALSLRLSAGVRAA